jgi:tellurite methyltransferase
MSTSATVDFFERQFQRQVRAAELQLNPFEQGALPFLRGRVLDFGCGLGNLAVAAARQGCSVLALDASPTAIEHLRKRANTEGLAVEARQAELVDYQLQEDFDAVAAIGLLMFLDCAHALRQLAQLQQHLRPGGVFVLNLLVQGTTYLDLFDPQQHCLLPAPQWQDCFRGWSLERCETQDFPAPGERVKSFLTLIARKPAA